MYLIVGEATYTRVTNLSFAPQADVTGSSLPINEFQVDVFTTDEISIGTYAELYDDLDTLWARYWIAYAEHIDARTVRVRAQSTLALLDRQTLPAIMYEGDSVTVALQDVFTALGSETWGMDSVFDEETLTGFAPEQTARERLQWICFVIGAYVRTFFTDRVWVRALDDTETLLPIDKTFWKPSVEYKDWVTALRVKAYAYREGQPQTTDQWVEAGGVYYIQTEQDFTLANPAAPAAAPENVVTVEGLTLIHAGNVSDILSHLSRYYFKRTAVELDAINNAEYMPGDRLIVYGDEDALYVGYAESCDFSFGVQARARMRIGPVDTQESARLSIVYVWEDVRIGEARYAFPVGYAYSVQNPYIDRALGRHRYVFRPLNAAATGTIAAGGNVDEEACAVALDLHEGVLHIISVDGATEEEGTMGENVVVIA